MTAGERVAGGGTAGGTGRAGARGWIALVGLLCAAPHVARMLLPTVAASEPSLGDAALMLSRGWEPYRHVAVPSAPLVESLLGFVVAAGGPRLRLLEACQAGVVLLVAVALFVAGRRLAGTFAGAVAALAWSTSTWLVHFNLFARETWASAGIALALCVAAGRPAGAGGRPVRLALALLLAAACDVTVLPVAAAFLVHRLLARQAPDALRLLLALGVAGALLLLAGAARFGDPFLAQVLGPQPWAPGSGDGVARDLGRLLGLADATLAAGLAALLVVGLPRLARPEGAAALALLAGLAALLVPDRRIEGHHTIALLPAAALLVGVALAELRRDPRRAEVAAAAAAVVVTAMIVLPDPRGPDEGPRRPVFDGRDRDVVARQADLIGRFSRFDDVVAAARPWCAFAADRLAFPPGRAAAGGRESWLSALTLREIALVVDEPLPEAVSAADLKQAGYRPFTDAQTGLTAWRPAQGRPRPVVRALDRS